MTTVVHRLPAKAASPAAHFLAARTPESTRPPVTAGDTRNPARSVMVRT
jgi:hypothetical protein